MQKKSQFGISSAGAARLARASGRAGVPAYTYANVSYPFAFTSSSTTANTWYWQFRLNSLYDPDFTGGGSQPTTFDQWMALYDRYRVIACEVDLSVSILNLATPIQVAFAPSVDAAPTLTYPGVGGLREAVIARPKGYASTGTLKHVFLMKDALGVDEEALMSELNYSGSSSTSAPAVVYGNVAAFTGGATDPVMCSGVLRFAVRFEAPHANNVSLAKATRLVLPAPAPVLGGATFTTTGAEEAADRERRALFERLRELTQPTGAAVSPASTGVGVQRH
jgi:hypothetical protein